MKKKTIAYVVILSFLFFMVTIGLFSQKILTFLGGFLIVNEEPVPSDAVIVLNTGIEYYPRLIEAADLYQHGYAKKVVINGNRKTDTLRKLEAMGFKYCCPWYEDRIRILELFGVNREDIIIISAEDVFDTISEAQTVGKELLKQNIKSLIITTSKSHTRRARHIWKKVWPKQFRMVIVASKSDSYNPKKWWRDGRQIKWVMAEYGAWLYYLWKFV